MPQVIKLNQFEDVINLSTGHSLFMGNAPINKINLSDINEKIRKDSENHDIESFGLFDTSQPNYTTYYPDVTEDDLNPKESDFIYPTFRMLSEVTVHKKSNPVNFSKNGVLKNSMKLLLGQTVNVDHEMAVGNAIGTVYKVEYQESYKSKNGVIVPAGINAVLKLDGKSNPRLARGIMMDPPSIHSNSVTILFKWEPSHPDIELGDFWSKLGTYDKDGNLYERIATKVMGYLETSLVSHGADPFAKKLEKGEIVLDRHADEVYSLSANEGKSFSTHYISFKDIDTDVLSNSSSGNIQTTPAKTNNEDKNKPTKTIKNMPEFLIKLAQALGLDKENQTEETLLTALSNQLKQNNDSIASLNKKITEHEATIQNLQPKADLGDEYLTGLIDQAKNKYSALKGDKAKESILENITKMNDAKSLKDMIEDYEEQLEEKHPLTCKSCGSTEVNRASSSSSEEEEEEEEERDKVTNKSREDIKKGLLDKETNKSRIFGIFGSKEDK